MSGKKLQHEIIVWQDSWAGYDSAPTAPEDIDSGYYLVDAGFLVKETPTEVIIAQSTSAALDDTRVKHVSGILKKCIISRTSREIIVRQAPKKRKKAK